MGCCRGTRRDVPSQSFSPVPPLGETSHSEEMRTIVMKRHSLLPVVAKADYIMFSPPSVNGTPERWPPLKPAAPLKSDTSWDDSAQARLPLTSFGV